MTRPSPPPSWPSRDADHLLVSGEAMAALERELFASGLPVEALMEKAALAVSRRLLAGPPARALVLAGPGHNGGDGLVVARELHLAGVPVAIWSPFERRKPLTGAHLRHARWLGIPLLAEDPDPADPALWIDALFGIGQRRPPGEAIERLLDARQRCRPGALVAIDGPTGLCADTGRRVGAAAATAQVTYTIGLIKQGFVQDSALAHVGRLERIDLGLPPALLAGLPADRPLGLAATAALAAADAASAPWPALDPAAGKYGRGRLLVVAGSRRYRGAAQLALSGATASGCGSLRAALPAELGPALWTVQPHVVLEPPLEATGAGGLSLAGLAAGALERLDAVLVGPGLGRGEPAAEAGAWERLQAFGGLLVLDADGLNRLAAGDPGGDAGPAAAAAWLRGRGGPTWITPHAGEFGRLFPDLAGLPPPEATAAAAARSGAAVLRKGARSVIAAPDGRCWQLLQATPAAARAGLGDVLAGYAAGRGAMAIAAAAALGQPQEAGGDGALLAAAALDHALAGGEAAAVAGPGGATPAAVAGRLMHRGEPLQGSG
ncbi:MAG: NAD(P)H-hydrate epimerase [Synechococcaceae cyanobacterium]|nr:NAD(P)H-hydrate epimerase [Synechococcaceae cyanobacterium]